MRWLSNIHDPKDKDAKLFIVRSFDETPEQAWHWHMKWLEGKHIGRPQATDFYTVEQLEEMGMVGVYVKEA